MKEQLRAFQKHTPKRIDGKYCRPYCRLKAHRKRRRESEWIRIW